MKILLTGATGFIGANFLRQALARGHQVAALASPAKTSPADLSASERLLWLRGTLSDAPWQEIDAFAPEVCVHAAWITTPGVYLESPENVQLVQDSLSFLKRTSASGAKQIVALGTCIEYQITREKLSEITTPIAPNTVYAKCKNDLRIALESAAAMQGWSFCWARVFYPYGPGEQSSRLGSSLIQKLEKGEPIVLKTPASTKDYIYIDDLGSALLTVVEKKFVGPINLASGIGVTVREIADTAAVLLNKAGLVSEAQPQVNDPFDYVVADIQRLKSLGWQTRVDLATGLKNLVAAHTTKR